MKKITFNLKFSLLLIIAFLVAFSGCNDDDDISKADFIGSYMVEDICDDNPYTMTISDVSGSDDAVTITNLWDWEEQMSATVNGSALIIPSQVADEVTFSGTGIFSGGNTLTITYTAIDNIGTENCLATATKQ